jgi:GNAT superfamily N-acetyltransferase
VNIQIESLSTCWDEIVRIGHEHWKETEGYRHNQPFAPSFERYKSYEDCGWGFTVTVRDEANLVGYSIMYVCPSMHTQELIATEDTFFLLPDYRKGWTAIRLLKFVENECARRGAVEICQTAKLKNSAGDILIARGYTFVAKQYSKRLAPANSHFANEVELSNVQSSAA